MPHKLSISLNPGLFKIPIKIITPKVAKNKQDSIFYAGKGIAEVKFLNYIYVLTTAGYYKFSLKVNGENNYNDTSKCVKSLTDSKIKKMNKDDLLSDWGWFGLNIMEQDAQGLHCLPEGINAWSEYDEAMDSFKIFVSKHITNLIKGTNNA